MNRQPYSGHSIDIEMVTETAALLLFLLLKMNISDGNLPKSREIPVFTDPDRERNLQETNSVERFPYFRRSILFCFVIYFVVT